MFFFFVFATAELSIKADSFTRNMFYQPLKVILNSTIRNATHYFFFFVYLQSSKNSELFRFLSLLSTHQVQMEPPVFSLLSTFLEEMNWKIENVNISAQ